MDRSGSMGGGRIEMASQAAKLFVKSLPENSKFNVVSFGNNYEEMFEGGSVSYN